MRPATTVREDDGLLPENAITKGDILVFMEEKLKPTS
jgi:hypothetical protein